MTRGISRRLFLGGASACVGLPLLDAMWPSFARADAPVRLITIVFPHGIRPDTWHPTGNGSSWSLSEDLSPLSRHKSKLVSIGGLDRSEHGGLPGDHPRGWGSILTQADLQEGSRRNGVSFDQVAATALGAATPRVPSLCIAAEGQHFLGGADGGFLTYLGSYLSWSDPDTPVPPLVAPREIFDRLFAGYDATESASVLEARRRRERSVLDWVRADIGRLTGRLGSSDRARLDEYATRLRALEASIFAEPTGPLCEMGGAPGDDSHYPTKLDQIFRLMALAVQCDLTRVITLNLGDVYSGLRPSTWGIPELSAVRNDGLHTVSHQSLDELSIVNRWWASELARFLDVLDGIDEGGTSALGNTVLLFTSEMEHGPHHAGENMPIVLAGSAGGRLVTDRRLVAPTGTPMANLYVSLLDLLGVPVSTFGAYGREPLTGLR